LLEVQQLIVEHNQTIAEKTSLEARVQTALKLRNGLRMFFSPICQAPTCSPFRTDGPEPQSEGANPRDQSQDVRLFFFSWILSQGVPAVHQVSEKRGGEQCDAN